MEFSCIMIIYASTGLDVIIIIFEGTLKFEVDWQLVKKD